MNEYYLSKGSHDRAEDGRCAMEWVAYIAGEPHTYQPVCVDQPLKSFCISFNDALDDEQRQKLRPYLARCIGTAGDGRTSERGYMCLDWLIRTYTPAWLDLAGLTEDAQRLRGLPEITDLKTAKQAGPIVRGARDRARAARDAAWDAAWAAAWDAAGDAAWEVAWDALASTVKALQASAFDLLDRMLPKVMIDLPEPAADRAREICEVAR